MCTRTDKTKNCFHLILLLFCGVALVPQISALSDKRLCADPNCQEIISTGTGKISYRAGEEGMVSFNINSQIRIKSKSAGSDKKLWGIEVNGREGYAPKEYILETKVLISEKNLKHEMPVQLLKAPAAAVMEDSESTARISEPLTLKPSENAEPKLFEAESTITAPLREVVEQQPIVMSTEEAAVVKPQQASPVQQKVEIVDGTEIPILEDTYTTRGGIRESDEEDDDATVDVDDDEDYANHGGEEIDISAEQEVLAPSKNIQIQSEEPLYKTNEPVADLNIEAAETTNTPKDDEKTPTHENEPTKELPTDKAANVESMTNENDMKKALAEGLAPTADTKHINVITNDTKEQMVADISDQQQASNQIQIAGKGITNASIKLNEFNTSAEVPVETTSKATVFADVASENIAVGSQAPQAETMKAAEPRVFSENVTKPSHVTEPGFAYHEHYNGDSFDTTTMPTPKSKEITTPNAINVDAKNPTLTETIVEKATTKPEIQVPQQFPAMESTTPATAPLTLQKTETVIVEETDKAAQYILNEHSIVPTTPTTTKSEKAAEEVIPNIKQELPAVHEDLNVPTMQAQQQVQAQNEDLNVPTTQEQQQDQAQEQLQAQDVKTSSFEEQVPINTMPTTLPLFRQPPSTVPEPHNQQHSGEIHQNTNEDPNEYYRLKAEEADVPTPLQYAAPSLPSLPTPYYKPAMSESQEEEEQKANISTEVTELNADSSESNKIDAAEVDAGSVESLSPLMTSQEPQEPLITMPSQAHQELPIAMLAPTPEVDETKKDPGLFATIVGTVNSFLSTNDNKKDKLHTSTDNMEDADLQRILFPERNGGAVAASSSDNNKPSDADMLYCERISPHNCPSSLENSAQQQKSPADNCLYAFADITWDNFTTILSAKVLEMSELLACLSIAASASLFFLFGYYCFCNSSREGALLSKLNMLERSLLATHKENAILKQDVMNTRSKLSSIEDNSFGSNDMVMSLRKELEEERIEKFNLQEQVNNLGKELEQAAEAGLELNRIVSEVLSNQSGDESIISSVEELQKQLNEQQNTILEINSNLADKSRENSELQLMIAEQNARLGGEIASLQQDNEELESEKNTLKSRLDEVKGEFEEDITKALEGKNLEIKRLQNEIVELTTKCEVEHSNWQRSLAKVEALEDCLKSVKRDPKVNITQVIDVANIRAELLDIQRQRNALKERLDVEMDARKLAEEQIESVITDIEKVKLDFHQSEKDKLEAQTRLEVLSNYFKDKETQLQKELSLKEAMWLKQQGETTSTVERVTSMQDEIQTLKSQNDSLRAEIEAQLAAHKAQIGTLEHRALDSYLEARQFQRRYEEVRTESYALRRKLTTLAGGEPNADAKLNNNDLNNAPSPLSMDPPGSPMIPFLPPPFIPPFLGMPPPPFVPPPGEMRPPPLGRIMSPPPAAAGISVGGGVPTLPPPHLHSRSGRYSPPSPYRYGDDYYDDDDDDDVELPASPRRRRGCGINGSWRRDDSYSPPPRTYRSHSPADSRYNYTADRDLRSTYDTETDFSPPASPRDQRRTTRGSRAGSYKAYSPQPTASSPISNSNNNNSSSSKKTSAAAKTTNKGVLSSGSEKSSEKSLHRGKKKNKSMV